MNDWVDEVLDFWFALKSEQWWKQDPALDEQIRTRFGELRDDKRQLPAESFLGDARTALAAVVLFDQFPRNMFRGLAEQFSTDPLAIAVAWQAVQRGLDEQLSKAERGILYMPFQHSEDVDDQRQSLLLFTALGDDGLLGYARKHHDIVAKFGRFPHRNSILGRQPREAEIAAGDVVPW
ncbi:MAG: DUF924 domain-containing protein [Pseudomonadota bacterium]|nr:DUF924 domain-containing protein [Sphingomonas sp.]MDQ3479106.1 DUF924 domain-containing protein [Pseudomonadota bacterium]